MSSSPEPPEGTRAIRLEVEVQGTPEQVWQAVATGPGITSWYVPTEVEGREGGAVTMSFGEGMDVAGRVTVWDPPHRFAYESLAAADRQMAFEFLVEARDGGTCVVRLVNSGFGTGEEWDGEFDGMASGWGLFLANLRLALAHFPGQPAACVIANGAAEGPRPAAWDAVTGALGLAVPAEGERAAATAADAPPLAGTVQRLADGMVTLLLDEPAPGIAFVAAEGSGEQIWISVYVYVFGARAAEEAARQRPRWRAWMERHFPVDQGAASVATP